MSSSAYASPREVGHKPAPTLWDRRNKIPEVTLLFWIEKICATTLGETAGDLLSMTVNLGYAASTAIFLAFFVVTLAIQLAVKKYIPPLYWAVIVSTSTAGTTISDLMNRTFGLGYALGSLILVTCLIATLCLWKWSEGSLSVNRITTFRGEIFYWIAILFSNTLGTSLGDFLADDSGLGFMGAAALITVLLLLVILLHYVTKISSVILFWIAFVLTRPFGATFGDVLTKTHKQGGLDLGTGGSSLVIFGLLVALVIGEMIWRSRTRGAKLADA